MTGIGLKLPHGPHRRPMGSAPAPASSESNSEAGTTVAGCPRGAQWDSLGAAHRRSLARSARPLSTLSNRSSPLSAVAARRNSDAAAARTRGRSAGARQTRFVGDVHPPHETQLVEGTLEHRFTRAWPERRIGDAAYDSDPLDRKLWRKHRIRMIAPNRPNRLNQTQDGRELRRYCRRWKIERLFAWLHNFRRLVTRWEFYEANFLGMLQLGCLIILLRNL